MRPKNQSRLDDSTKRSLARIGVSLLMLGISKCLGSGKRKSKNSGGSSSSSTRARPSKRVPKPRSKRAHTPSYHDLGQSQVDLVKLAEMRQDGAMVRFDARVIKILGDDREGDRHQRFLIAVDYDPSPIKTVLIAHNIDLAPRVPIHKGAILSFYGQYEWNDRGGLLHWTHHDPSNWREGGWIEYGGKRYE